MAQAPGLHGQMPRFIARPRSGGLAEPRRNAVQLATDVGEEVGYGRNGRRDSTPPKSNRTALADTYRPGRGTRRSGTWRWFDGVPCNRTCTHPVTDDARPMRRCRQASRRTTAVPRRAPLCAPRHVGRPGGRRGRSHCTDHPQGAYSAVAISRMHALATLRVPSAHCSSLEPDFDPGPSASVWRLVGVG
jgi:hypothetical protein